MSNMDQDYEASSFWACSYMDYQRFPRTGFTRSCLLQRSSSYAFL